MFMPRSLRKCTWHWPLAAEVCRIHEHEMLDPGATGTIQVGPQESSGNPLLPQMTPLSLPRVPSSSLCSVSVYMHVVGRL